MSSAAHGGRTLRGAISPPPMDLREQYEQIAARAAAAGYPLQPTPTLHVAGDPRQGSRALFRPEPAVWVAQDLLALPPHERAFILAHELAHHVHRQHRCWPRRYLLLLSVFVVLAALSFGTLATGLVLGLITGQFPPDAVRTLSVVAGLVGLLVVLAASRQQEAGTDATAATLFGEALTERGVERMRHQEGRAAARPSLALLRTHPRPERRRQHGLALLRNRPSTRGAADNAPELV